MKALFLGLLVGGLTVTAAQAEVVVFDYTAVVTGLEADGNAISSFTIDGKAFSAGQTIRGSFGIDLETPLYDWRPDAPGAANHRTYKNDNNIAEMTVDQTGFHFKSAPGPYLSGFSVGNTAQDDYFYYESGSSVYTDTGDTSQYLMFGLSDRTGQLVSSAAPPTTLSLDNTTRADFSYWLFQSSLPTYTVNGTLTSLTPHVSNVPEPHTYAMLVMGLLTTGALARRRQTRR